MSESEPPLDAEAFDEGSIERGPVADEPTAREQDASEPLGWTRTFKVGNETWVARVAGAGTAGTGAFAKGVLVVVLFHRSDETDRARRFTYLPRGRLEALFDSELQQLFAEAAFVQDADSDRGTQEQRP
ncbi:MAG: hypothetical protein ACREL7_18455 [Longimicrobiales bacterium]